jgi:uncharacterized membrane protein
MFHLTTAGAIHTTLAAAAIILGIIQFLRRKGDSVHRAAGYAYVYALLIGDGAAMLVYQFTGKLNILHFGVITNLVCIAIGMWPVLHNPRRPGWRKTHYYWISWSYVGVLAAAATELVVRTAPLGGRGQTWVATAIVTLGVTLAGYVIITRNRPLIYSSGS